jgi:hypothetical protein
MVYKNGKKVEDETKPNSLVSLMANYRTPVKTSLDSIAFTLLSLAVAGFGFGVYERDWVACVCGAGAGLLGVILIYVRHKTNDSAIELNGNGKKKSKKGI